ncbi:hypothetical protein ACFXTO_010560 [Malus domestica]
MALGSKFDNEGSWEEESAAPPLPSQQASAFGLDLDPHQARKISVMLAQYRSKARNKYVHCSGCTSTEFFWFVFFPFSGKMVMSQTPNFTKSKRF